MKKIHQLTITVVTIDVSIQLHVGFMHSKIIGQRFHSHGNPHTRIVQTSFVIVSTTQDLIKWFFFAWPTRCWTEWTLTPGGVLSVAGSLPPSATSTLTTPVSKVMTTPIWETMSSSIWKTLSWSSVRLAWSSVRLAPSWFIPQGISLSIPTPSTCKISIPARLTTISPTICAIISPSISLWTTTPAILVAWWTSGLLSAWCSRWWSISAINEIWSHKWF